VDYEFGKHAVTEFIGVAAPVVTPLSAAVKNNTLGRGRKGSC